MTVNEKIVILTTLSTMSKVIEATPVVSSKTAVTPSGNVVDISFGHIGPQADGLTPITIEPLDPVLIAEVNDLVPLIQDAILTETMQTRNFDRFTGLLMGLRNLLPTLMGGAI